MPPMDDDTALEDLILAFALAPSSGRPAAPLRGKTALQKLIFHLRKSLDSVPGQEVPHFYGPFNEAVQVAFEQLETSGYLQMDPDSSSISLTARGEREARSVWRSLPPDVRKLVEELKEIFGDLNSSEVLAITYAEFPESAEDSIVREDLVRKGPSIALSLVKREKVSPELGAKIAGMSLRDFLKYLSRNKVPVVEDGPMGRIR